MKKSTLFLMIFTVLALACFGINLFVEHIALTIASGVFILVAIIIMFSSSNKKEKTKEDIEKEKNKKLAKERELSYKKIREEKKRNKQNKGQ